MEGSIHHLAIRVHGDLAKGGQAKSIWYYLTPLFRERASDPVTEVGWGLKTLGRYSQVNPRIL